MFEEWATRIPDCFSVWLIIYLSISQRQKELMTTNKGDGSPRTFMVEANI